MTPNYEELEKQAREIEEKQKELEEFCRKLLRLEALGLIKPPKRKRFFSEHFQCPECETELKETIINPYKVLLKCEKCDYAWAYGV